MRNLIVAVVVALLSTTAVSAATVTLSSDGSFFNISGCKTVNCSISPSGNTLYLSGYNPSKMVANDYSSTTFQTGPVATTQTLGSITWTNNRSYYSDQNFNVLYSFALNFSEPNVQAVYQNFTLNITQPTNPLGDNALFINGAALPNYSSINLNGVFMSNLRFVVTGAGLLKGNTWSNPEDGVSRLNIVADFASPVPEASTWAMMCLGFAGVGAMAYRKVRHAPAMAA